MGTRNGKNLKISQEEAAAEPSQDEDLPEAKKMKKNKKEKKKKKKGLQDHLTCVNIFLLSKTRMYSVRLANKAVVIRVLFPPPDKHSTRLASREGEREPSRLASGEGEREPSWLPGQLVQSDG